MARRGYVAAIGITAVVLIAGAIAFSGLIIVRDTSGHFRSAVLMDGWNHSQKMHRLFGGIFIAVPNLEGHAVLECDNGPRIGFGYVTPGLPMYWALDSRALCYTEREVICRRSKPERGELEREIWDQERDSYDCQTSSTSRP